MEDGAAQHEVGRHFADVGAVLQKPDVIRCCMTASFVQAMCDHLLADLMAHEAILNAKLHIIADRLEDIFESLSCSSCYGLHAHDSLLKKGASAPW